MKNKYITFAIAIILSTATSTILAQSTIPTLKQQLRLPNADSAQLLYELGIQYQRTKIDSCFYFLNASLGVAERKNNPKVIAQAMFGIGSTYLYFLKNDEKAIKWLNKAIVVAKQQNNNVILAKSYGALSIVDGYQNTNNADALLSKALNYAKATKDWEIIALVYDNIATRRLAQNNYKAAEIAIFNAMSACENHSPDDWLSYGLDYTDFLESDNRKEEAFAFNQKLDGVRSQLKQSKGAFVYAMDIARLEVKLKHYAQADSLLQNALQIEKAKTTPDTFHLLVILQDVLHLEMAQGNALKASQAASALVNIRLASKEKRLTEESKRQMAGTQSALDLEKKDSEIAILDEQKKRQQLFLIGMIIIALLLGGFMVVLQRNKRRIEAQKAELTAVNATKDKLFSIVAHDLRSPIGALKSHLTMTNYGMMSQAEFTTASKRLTTDVNALFQSLDNLLHWSYSQQKGIKAKPETINLHAIAEEQIKLLTEIAAQKNITVVNDISQEATVFADRNQIGLVIRNLVSNSLKFTNNGGKVVLESKIIPPLGGTRGATEGGKLELKIMDNGIGMSQTLQNQLFKIQEQVSRLGTSGEAGHGLGLILTKELTELNGGTMTVESEVGKGTRFSLVF